MADKPYIIGGGSQAQEAVQVLNDTPYGHKALGNTTAIVTSQIPTAAMSALSRLATKLGFGDGWTRGGGRSFAAVNPLPVGPGGVVFMSPKDSSYTETLAHELGHIEQGRNGLLADGNGPSSDAVLNQARRHVMMLQNLIPDAPRPNADRAETYFNAFPDGRIKLGYEYPYEKMMQGDFATMSPEVKALRGLK